MSERGHFRPSSDGFAHLSFRSTLRADVAAGRSFYESTPLVANGEDLRSLPLHLRKNNLARMLARRIDGIMLNDYEQGGIGPDLFSHACMMGLGGLGIGPRNCETHCELQRCPSAR